MKPPVLRIHSLICQEQGGISNKNNKILQDNRNEIRKTIAVETLPHCIVKIQNLDIMTLLDTGAASNFMVEVLARKLHFHLQELHPPIIVKGAWSKPTTIKYYCETDFYIGNTPYQTTFLVIPQPLVAKLILGIPFIKQNNGILESVLKEMKQEESKPIEISTWRKLKKLIGKEGTQSFVCWISSTPNKVQTTVPLIEEEFQDVVVDKLPTYDNTTKTISHEIKLIPGSSPVFKRAYRMSEAEKEELNRQLKELLQDNRIEPCDSPFAAPVIFVKKKDGTKRLCVDYRQLNDITIKAKYPIPIIEDLFDQLRGATIFSKLDLISGYHQVPIDERDKSKTAFVTHAGQYQWNVMPFGLTNAPATFQRLMNHVLRAYLGKFCVVYLDDILIYSKDKEEHEEHLRKVLNTLRQHHLFAKKAKCEFFLTEISFLGHIINANGISSDPEKVKCIQSWIKPKDYKDCQRFLGLIGWYRRFIKDFSRIAAPLRVFANQKTQKWSTTQQEAFDALKERLLTAPILKPFDPSKSLILTTDASDYAVGATLEMCDPNSKAVIGVVAYLSKALHGHEVNWSIREKEFFAIVHALHKWRHYLLGKKFLLRTDHESLKFIIKAKDTKQRLMRWWDDIAEFNFTIEHISGTKNHADALSRLNTITIDTRTVSQGSYATISRQYHDTLHEEYTKDPYFIPIFHWLVNHEPVIKEYRSIIKHYTYHDGLIYYKNNLSNHYRLAIPLGKIRALLLQLHHDSNLAGHPGPYKTFQSLLRDYYWPNMIVTIRNYIRSCINCQNSKHVRLLPPGTFTPLAIPKQPWSSISIDFVTGMRPSGKLDCILVVTDRLTKWSYFIPTFKKLTAVACAELILNKVVCNHGIPEEIVSDRDKLFTGAIWDRLHQRLRIKLRFSTSYNPAANGQVERTNGTMISIIRTMVQEHPEDWPHFIDMAQFAYNSSFHESIQMSPFYANFGYHPRVPGFSNELTDPTPILNEEDTPVPGTLKHKFDQHLQALQTLWSITQQNMSDAQDRQSINFNRHHREVDLKEGDLVMLHKDAYQPKPGTKFHHLWYGPFKILKKLSSESYKLDLKASHPRRHDTFNIKKLKPFHPRTTLLTNVPPNSTQDITKSISNIEKVVEVFEDKTCEVRWNNAEVWDTSIIPVACILNSEMSYLLNPFRQGNSLRVMRLEES